MKATDIATKNVVTISPVATITEATQLMQINNIRALIVERSDREDAYGIITATDIIQKVVATKQNASNVRVGEVMTKPCVVVNPDLAIEHIAKLFINLGIHHAPVIKEKLLGIISVSDLLSHVELLEYSHKELLKQEIQSAYEQLKQQEKAILDEYYTGLTLEESEDIYQIWCSG